MKKFVTIISLFLLIFSVSFGQFNPIKVSGIVKLNDINLGAITLNFIDSQNQIISTETDIQGKFSVNLLKGKYRIKIKDYGYSLVKDSDVIYNFNALESNTFYLTLEATEMKSFISGSIIDTNNKPVSGATLKIKNVQNTLNVIADENGNFKTDLPNSGFYTIIASAQGYDDNIFIQNITRVSSVTDLKIVLNKKYITVSGNITDGINSLASVKISAYLENGELISSTTSKENGYYELNNLPSDEPFYIVATLKNFQDSTSSFFLSTTNIENNNIILTK